MKRIILLLVLLACVAIGVYLWVAGKPEVSDATRWLSVPLNNVKSIHVQGQEGSYVLLKKDDQWEVQVPGASWNVAARGIASKVTAYVEMLSTVVSKQSLGIYISEGASRYGLDNPELKVLLQGVNKDGTPLVIKVGVDDSGSVYGWNSAEPSFVYEFDSGVMAGFNRKASHFFDTRVFLFDEKTVDKVKLVQPFGSSWLVEKKKEGFYFSLPGYLKNKPVSDSKLGLYIHTLSLLRGSKLVLEPVVTDKRIPALSIKLWWGKRDNPSIVEFFTIKDNPDYYLGKSSWQPVPFLLDVQSVSELIKSAFDIQGRTVVKLNIGNVAQFIVQHGEREYLVGRGETGWRVDGEGKDIPGIDMALWRFTELQFEALPINNLPDSAIKLMYCRLMDEAGEKLTEVTFYADPKLPQGQCWMKNGGQMYYPVSSRLLKDLQGMFPITNNNQ